MRLIEHRTILSYDGSRLSYYLKKGKGPYLVFIHGLGANHTVWNPIIKDIDANIITLDLRGHGRSEVGMLSDINISNYCLDVKNIMDEEGIKDAIIIGNSLGATIAVNLAKKYPSYVNKLFLFSLFSKRFSNFNIILGFVNNIAYHIIKPFRMKRGLRLQDYAKLRKKMPWFFPIADIKGTHLHVYTKTIKELLTNRLPIEDINQNVLILQGNSDILANNTKIYKTARNNKNIKIKIHKMHHLVVNKSPDACIKMIKDFI